MKTKFESITIRLSIYEKSQACNSSKFFSQLTSDEFSHMSELETLKKRMQQLVYDQDVCTRLIEATRRRLPNKSEVEIYRNEIDRIERDRR